MKRICCLVSFYLLLSGHWPEGMAQDYTLNVWPQGVPGSINDPAYRMQTLYANDSSPRITRVTDPQLEVYLAPPAKATGAAVVICPGGGYGRLAIDHEGYQVAEWLNTHGITGIILVYRLPSDAIMEDKSIGPLQDAQEAVRIVRRNSREWNIDPGRIGIMGFSAGGHLASTASTQFDEMVYTVADETSARPDFSILIYPVISMDGQVTHRGSRDNLLGKDPTAEMIRRFSSEERVGADNPPAFLVHSLDDRAVPPENSIRYVRALREHRIPAELHLYERGGHGYGLGRGDGTETTWPDACIRWLRMHGFLGEAGITGCLFE